tara:strand:+ start:275794 stop:277599 length:1806 start_codon:yes stop_codon:yes gene_type:complete
MTTSKANSDIQRIIENVLSNMPSDWLRLTTHRLDIYNEKLAKFEFLEKFESANHSDQAALRELPTAFDYIRLGHPLSCVLEWSVAKEQGLKVESVISFSSQSMPILAVLRKNKFSKKKTLIAYKSQLPLNWDSELVKETYQYDFELKKIQSPNELTEEFSDYEGSTILISNEFDSRADFNLILLEGLGSIISVNNNDLEYIKEIQHVRRRESIAMTPQNSLIALENYIGKDSRPREKSDATALLKTIQDITSSQVPASLGSCGLSVQYAIMMGLINYANLEHKGKDIKFIVPPNCYGGTNDQARRVAACVDNVEIIDLPVDSGKDMVTELERILSEVALEDAVPYIIAEIPTNPRVEIPDLENLRLTLKKERQTKNSSNAVMATFVLDQTFCPNVKFFGDHGFLRDASTISYVSGSKFPSGGLCTAGYAVANESAAHLMPYVQKHLELCDNEATPLQVEILTKEMPSMNERIADAYKNTRAFVDFIEKTLPSAKINFVSHELADKSFTPSVFSLDLPAKSEEHKRELNHKLIRMMIDAIPDESKHCVSYGQLKGCYWTIPATSTQGTTKESDKDYIVRVSVAADFSLEKHCDVFKKFCEQL